MNSKFLLAGLLITAILLSGCAEQPPSGFSVYEKEGIRLEYPSDWELVGSMMGALMAVRTPPEDEADTFGENVNVYIEDLSAFPMNLEEYTALSLENGAKLITNWELVKIENATLAGLPGKKIEYTATMEIYDELHYLAYYTIKNNKAYVVTYTAKKESYQKYLSTAEQIIQSFEIK